MISSKNFMHHFTISLTLILITKKLSFFPAPPQNYTDHCGLRQPALIRSNGGQRERKAYSCMPFCSIFTLPCLSSFSFIKGLIFQITIVYLKANVKQIHCYFGTIPLIPFKCRAILLCLHSRNLTYCQYH